ncbi:MAG: ComEC/Rec2 family competence protein [Megasphaera sp.]|jgi:competence protein ComEC|nr:ComEC/Rec2 family competence protein [Megasphaera sp.]
MIYAGIGLAAAFWSGIWSGDRIGAPLYVWLAAAGVFLILGVLVYQATGVTVQEAQQSSLVRKRIGMAAILLGVVCLGAGRIQWAEQDYAALPRHLAGAEVRIAGTVQEKGYSFVGDNGAMTRYLVSIQQVAYTDEAVFRKGAGALYITVPAVPVLPLYATVSYTGTVKALTYYRNEGMYDARHRDRAKGVFLKSYSTKADGVRVLHRPGSWQAAGERLREHMTSVFLTVLDTDGAHILSSLLFGGHYDELPPSLLESFSSTGLIHILSVSGSHVALVLAVVQLAGQAAGLGKRKLFFLSAAFVLFYGALSAYTAPVIRASVMGLVCAYSLTARREYTAIHALALAIFGMLLYNPYTAFDLSFQLSCGASAGIVLLQRRVSSHLLWLPVFLRDGAAVCLCAQLLLVPLLFANFHAFPVYSLAANILVAPVLEVIIIVGLAAAVAGCFFLPLAQGLLWIIDPLLAMAVKGNYFLAALPGSRLWSGALAFPSVCAWYMMIAAVFFLPRQRRPLVLTAALACAVPALWGGLCQADVVVRVFDMGADRATCAVYSDNSVHLWYNKSQWSNPEQVACVLTPALQYNGIFRLQGCTVTGAHSQRTAAQIAARFPVQGKWRSAMAAEQVAGGTIPYYMYMKELPAQFPRRACIEIQSLQEVQNEAFPKDAAAVIVHGRTSQGDRYTEWLENADLYEVPCFSPARDGEITGSYRKGVWTFRTNGGDMA